MRKFTTFCLLFILSGVLAACTTHPAMAPDHVAALHSGKIVVVAPRPIFFLQPRGGGGMPLFIPMASGLPLVITGPSSNEGFVLDNGSPAKDTKILKPYKQQMEDLPVVNEFITAIRQASEQIVWMHGSSLVAEYDKSLDIGQMRRMTQNSDVNAVAFIQPVVLFAHSLNRVYILATIGVYAHGPRQATPIDGGRFIIEVTLGETLPALSSHGMEAIAASASDDQAEREARAEVWFANDAARLKQALAYSMMTLRQDINNYLNGRRTPD